MRGLGYATAVSGKWQHAVSPGECGFDRHFVWSRWNTDRVIYPRYWQPVLWKDSVKRQFDQYGPDLIADWTIDFLRTNSPAFVLHNELLAHKERDGTFKPTPDDPTGTRKGNIVYWTKIVARIVKALPDTLVIITSDNGSEATTKNQTTGDGPQTILIIVGPGVVPGERHQLVDVSDFYPTILELAGGDGRGRDGVSFAEALQSPHAPGREWIYSWLDDKNMVRTHTHQRDGDGVIREVDQARLFHEVIEGVRRPIA
jgi:arylsulfatase A